MAQIQRRERADGTVRWKMQVFIGRDPQTGRRQFVTRSFDRKKDAEAEARRLERMKDHGALVTPSKVPFLDYLVRWLDEVKEPELRARTLHEYRGMVARYIENPPEGAPPIGSIRLDRLTPAAFQALYAHLWKETGLAPRTLRYLHTVLRQALGHAVRTGALARNPTDHVPVPKQAREGSGGGRKMRAMSKDEAARFLAASKSDRYAALWAVLLTGGLRPGEAFGLGWDDVDMEGGKLHVRRSLTRTGIEKRCACGHPPDEHDGHAACSAKGCKCERYEGVGGWKLTEPKTDRARRVVVLPPVAVDALRAWRKVQASERLLLGAEYQDHAHPFVFTTEFGAPLDGGNLTRNFKRVTAEAGLGEWMEPRKAGARGPKASQRFRPAFRIYDLRHTCATLLLLAGENPKVVSERLGHSSITLTLDTYSHVLPSMQEASADKLEAMFGAAS